MAQLLLTKYYPKPHTLRGFNHLKLLIMSTRLATKGVQTFGMPRALLRCQQHSMFQPRSRRPRSARTKALHPILQMHVPSDSFGGVSPERKAADIMTTLFTFIAVKIVMSQMEGVGRGDLGSYNAQGFQTLREFLLEHPLRNNADMWLARLMERDEMLAVRVMEVRAAYAADDFEWNNLERVAVEELKKANVRLMRQHASTRFESMLRDSSEAAEGEAT